MKTSTATDGDTMKDSTAPPLLLILSSCCPSRPATDDQHNESTATDGDTMKDSTATDDQTSTAAPAAVITSTRAPPATCQT